MAPKRRAPSDASAAPESNKRVTRSSTKQGPTPTPDLPKTNPQSRKTKAKSKGDPKPQPAKKNDHKGNKPPVPTASTPTKPPYITLTISSHLTKSPIECHNYPSPPHQPATTPPPPKNKVTHRARGPHTAPPQVHFFTRYASAAPITAFQGSANLGARVKAFRACHAHVQEEVASRGQTLVFGGRSMGVRAAVMAASELMAESSDGKAGGAAQASVKLVLVSYPLVGPKGDVRDGILLGLGGDVEVLFVSGDRDVMCPLQRLDEVRTSMAVSSRLVVVRGADHGMRTRPTGLERELGEKMGRVAADWLLAGMDEDEDVVYIGEE